MVPREIWEFYTVRGMSVIQLGVEPPPTLEMTKGTEVSKNIVDNVRIVVCV